jgi:TRAP-type C4-dicarboxylate transport system permease small subunit
MAFIASKARLLERSISNIEKILFYVGIFILAAMMFLGTADVIGRYIFNKPIIGVFETSKLMMGTMVFLSWAYTLACRGHLTADVIFNRYPPRVRAILGFIAMFLSLGIFGLIAWQNAILAVEEWQSGQIVANIHILVAPFDFLLVLGAFLFCLECIIQMVHLVPEIISKKKED